MECLNIQTYTELALQSGDINLTVDDCIIKFSFHTPSVQIPQL